MRLKFKVTSSMRYFWLKKVTGINLSVHCASCLTGAYWPGVNGNSRYGDIELPPGTYYLCGVAYPFVWENNFHLAFVDDPSSNISYSSNGVTVEIARARRILFSEDDIDINHPKRQFASYRTCRNWQFAHWLASNSEALQ